MRQILLNIFRRVQSGVDADAYHSGNRNPKERETVNQPMQFGCGQGAVGREQQTLRQNQPHQTVVDQVVLMRPLLTQGFVQLPIWLDTAQSPLSLT